MGVIRHAYVYARGKLAYNEITASYTNLLVIPEDIRTIFVFNSYNQPCMIKFPNPPNVSTTNHFELDVGESFVWDLRIGSNNLAAGTIQAKFITSQPTVGSLRITVAK